VLLLSLLPGLSAKPNFIIVLVDDHAFEAISAYGTYLKDYARTPAIDRIGNEGMRFDSFVCNNSICSPSRAAILTGQYSHVNGVKGLNGKIHGTSPCYSESLQGAGYQTWLVGKWHLSSQPRGYDRHMTVKGQGKYFNPTFNGSEGTWQRDGYSTDVYTDIAMQWLKERDTSKPFLLCLQFKAPHHEYGHAARYDKMFADVQIPEPPSLYEDVKNGNSNLKKLFIGGSKFHMDYAGQGSYYTRHLKDAPPNAMPPIKAETSRERIRVAYQHMIHKYIRCISGNDDNVKRVLDYLDEQKLAEDTVVIYTSDQGYWLGQHGMYDKRLILETSVRMPFLIRYPKMIKPGSVNSDICVNVDIAPTVLALAGVPAPDAMQGRSMVPLLEGQTPDNWRKSSFYAYWGGPPGHYGVRTNRYTYVKFEGLPTELFDRQADPDQLINVAGNPENREVLARLEAELQQQIKDIGISPDELPPLKRVRPPRQPKPGKKRNKAQ
jgi:arylsulfatase A-like enzyme